MLDAVKYWQKLYEQERENRDQELYTVKMNKERLVQDLEILRQTSIQHKEAVDAWLKIKEDRRQAENQRKKELEAASKIQVISMITSHMVYCRVNNNFVIYYTELVERYYG